MNAIAHIEQLLHQVIGLDPRSVGRARIASAVRGRMLARNVDDPGTYADLARESDEWQMLVDAVVVLETFFFREPAALTALGGFLRTGELTGTIESPLRVLSLPCSTGEEPYSIAMTLLALGCPDGAFRVDGVDISRKAIRQARVARYHARALRGSEPLHPEFFLESDDTLTLRDDVRSAVQFACGNVMASDFSPPQSQYDVVFCRNLLVYFDAAGRERVLSVIARHLRPDGVLFVAPADAFLVRTAGFDVLDAMSCAFRRRSADALSLTTAEHVGALLTGRLQAVLRQQPSQPASAAHRRSKRTTPPVHTSDEQRAGSPDAGVEAAIAQMTALANAGRMRDAARLGESVVSAAEAHAQLFFVLGTIHAALEDLDQAEACYRRALYLEPKHDDALLHMAQLLERRGNPVGAARLRERAYRGATECAR